MELGIKDGAGGRLRLIFGEGDDWLAGRTRAAMEEMATH
jgi:hypothetical protein